MKVIRGPDTIFNILNFSGLTDKCVANHITYDTHILLISMINYL